MRRLRVDDPVNGISVHGAGGLLGKHHRVHTEWQWPISGAHSIMMEKSALASEGGWCLPTPSAHPLSLYLPSSTKLQMYAPAESTLTTLPLFHFYPFMNSVVSTLPPQVLAVFEKFAYLL